MKDVFFVHPQKLLFRPLSKSPYDRQVGGVHVALSCLNPSLMAPNFSGHKAPRGERRRDYATSTHRACKNSAPKRV